MPACRLPERAVEPRVAAAVALVSPPPVSAPRPAVVAEAAPAWRPLASAALAAAAAPRV
jgi:hypothetical protein